LQRFQRRILKFGKNLIGKKGLYDGDDLFHTIIVTNSDSIEKSIENRSCQFPTIA